MATEAQLWKVAGKPDLGNERKKAFATPQIFLDKAFEYFKFTDENFFYRIEQAKKIPDGLVMPDGRVVPGDPLIELPVRRPYTEGGLCVFCGVNPRWLSTFEQKHRNQGMTTGVEERDNLWLDAIDYVKGVIRNQQYEGAAAGFFKENIVGRMIGLADKQEIETTVIDKKEYFEIGGKKFEL
jgi:hypothetical protein